ncbi:amidohydrolase family protein [Methylocaldum sp.]|uniref:amidohydrolase family protein n=1 Tax=Methylocaldum sp. TaxID=1969727 RepID=UPI002D4EA766|nr:amidohydrolase family protein [Methylocaldum sp.]HYE35969.1 amidohydrolase family protein [Methylocaldum sp.]
MTAFVGATLVDGTGGAPRADAVILVEGERIAAVGNRDEIPIPPEARVIDASGKWIVPGLIDAHIHFFQSGGLYTRPDVIDLRDVRPYADEIAGIRQRIPDTLARYVASGVTSVVDVGGPFWTFEVRDLAERTKPAPRVAVAGPLVATYLPPELKTDDPPLIKVDSPEESRATVREVLARKPDVIKIWFIPLPGQGLASQTAVVRAAIETSHAAGTRVVVHATELEVARAAVQAGADVLAHSVEDRRVDEAFIKLLKDRNVVYVTTLVVSEGYQEVLGRKVRLTDIERRLGDPEAIETFDDLARLPIWKKPWAFQWFSRDIAFWNLKRLQESGVTIAAGTDAGNIGTLHGPALHREFELMAEAGLSPREILTAATQGGARVMGRSAELGTVEKGKLADFLLLDADPLADITHLRRIFRAVKGGAIFDPQALGERRPSTQTRP